VKHGITRSELIDEQPTIERHLGALSPTPAPLYHLLHQKTACEGLITIEEAM
ncbi:hypothetical protein Bpfe_000161, partial [Biomphalaria pfeifferi]